eukprot:scaffold285_cov304-Pinguiococcus_pyrenoidosus.AAC.28
MASSTKPKVRRLPRCQRSPWGRRLRCRRPRRDMVLRSYELASASSAKGTQGALHILCRAFTTRWPHSDPPTRSFWISRRRKRRGEVRN